MKKSIYISLIALAGVLTTSCEDYLDSYSQSSLDEAMIFSNIGLAENAVMGIHVSFAETNSYRGRFLPYYGQNTDLEWFITGEETKPDDAKVGLCNYNAFAGNTEMNTSNGSWSKMYEGIERANLCIQGLRNFGNVDSDPDMAYLLGEALTLRAVYYADLIRAWGDVPARFAPITPETMYSPKSDQDIIYKQLINDLDEAANYVPWPNATTRTTSVERINKAFVKGLRARLCLYAGGYALRRDDKTVRLSNDPELSQEILYAKVISDCNDIINFYGGIGAELQGYEEAFRAVCEENLTAGKESLWEIPFAAGRGRMVYTFGVKHETTDKYTQQAKGGVSGPLPYVYYDFDVNDLRRDVSVVPYKWDGGIQVLSSLDKCYFGKLRYEWMTRVVTSTNDDGVNKQYMRYGDVILMMAEAKNHIEGAEAAKPYLKAIRKRAFAAEHQSKMVEDYVNKISSKEEMFTAIVDERGFEFVGEMIRKGDLIRWGLLSSKLAEAKQKMEALRERSGKYADVPQYLRYKYAENGEDLIIYGLNRGEVLDNEDIKEEYPNTQKWVDTDKISDYKLANCLFYRDPNQYMYWPIFEYFVNNSNNQLTNDYFY